VSRPVKLAPSLLSADFADIAAQIALVERAGADELHLDSMDGRFVPNLTWGMKIVRDLRRLTRLPFDCHLMIAEPERYVDAFREAGADVITFHYEATPHQHRLLRHLRDIGARAGIAINPGTPTSLLVDLIEETDRVLVMSVNPGFGGQSFIERALVKVAEVRVLLDARNPQCEIEVDGGIGLANLERAVQAGADVLVAGNSVFGAADPVEALHEMRRRIERCSESAPSGNRPRPQS
jgi:ribulose-phosphate 3-epimerase